MIGGDFSLSNLQNNETSWTYLNNTNQVDLTDIYRTLHSTTAENNFFSGAHEIFTTTKYAL